MSGNKLKILFIINSILKRSHGRDIPGIIFENIDTERFEIETVFTEYADHASEIAAGEAENYRVIVAAGGDGTVNQVARNLINCQTALGILPLGSGNGLARALGIPLDIRKAIETINGYGVKLIDTGLVGDRRFINIAGIGFSAGVAHAYSGSEKRGFLAYVLQSINKISDYQPVLAGIQWEEYSLDGEFFEITLANAPQWGYGAYISPTSKHDDGYLDLCLIRHFPMSRLPMLVSRLYAKTIHHSRYMETFRVRNILIEAEGTVQGHVDGEPVEFPGPLRVSIEPRSLQVISPLNP